MKKIYKRVKVNTIILKAYTSNADFDIDQLKQNEVSDTLPAGKVTGVYYNSYIQENSLGGNPPLGGGGVQSFRALPFAISHTDIVIKDTRGREITEPTDIQDYKHKGGGYKEGFKHLDFQSQNERITIAWETIGQQPICGEFIFEIEAPENC